jgi:hypothetical protein
MADVRDEREAPLATKQLQVVASFHCHMMARQNLDRHPNYIRAAFMASGKTSYVAELRMPRSDTLMH